jgi:hypothetical protein
MQSPTRASPASEQNRSAQPSIYGAAPGVVSHLSHRKSARFVPIRLLRERREGRELIERILPIERTVRCGHSGEPPDVRNQVRLKVGGGLGESGASAHSALKTMAVVNTDLGGTNLVITSAPLRLVWGWPGGCSRLHRCPICSFNPFYASTRSQHRGGRIYSAAESRNRRRRHSDLVIASRLNYKTK